MQTKRLSLLAAFLVVTVPHFAHAENHVVPFAEKYLRGTVGNDVAAALQRSATEHRPLWITAWDKAFFSSPEGLKGDKTHFSLLYFYENPETKNLLNQNFVQVFTTLDDPAIAPWIDPAERSHMPIYIVLDPSGKFVVRNPALGNAMAGLKAAQEVSVGLGLKKFADPLPPPPGWHPGPSSRSHAECTPDKYYAGTYTNDTAAALRRGAAEHWPVWIIAWDRAFYDSPDGQVLNTGDHGLHYFYAKAETKNLLSQNFIQVFTTLDDPAIAPWIDKDDRTHEPLNLIVDANGTFTARELADANAESAWKEVQEVANRIGIAADGNPKRGNPPVVPSKPDPRLADNTRPAQTPAPSVNSLSTRPAATAAATPSSTPMHLAINSTPPRLPAMPLPPPPGSLLPTTGRNILPTGGLPNPPGAPTLAPSAARIGIPQVSAKTNKAARHLTTGQSKNSRTEEDTHWMSVAVNATFFQKPEVEYQVQCFFIAKDEASPFPTIYDASVKTSREANFQEEFVSQPLVGTTRTFASVHLTSSDGTTSTNNSITASINREKVVGWIVRVVGEGRVLSVQSNQTELAGLVSTHKDNFDAVASQVLAAANYATTSTGPAGETTTAYLVVEDGMLHVPLMLNGVLPCKFMVDSGAFDVLISPDVYRSLVRAGTVQPGDKLPSSTSVLADGSEVPVEHFILHSIRLGNTTVTNVRAAVGPPKSSLLLGQSFLRRFREWKIDNTISALILKN